MTDNSFLHPLGEVHFDRYAPDDALPALAHAERTTWLNLDAVLDLPASERTFDNTVLAFTEATAPFEFVHGIIDHLDSTVSGPWVDLSRAAAEKSTELSTAIEQHVGLYEALLAVRDAGLAIDARQDRLLTELITDYEVNGIALDPTKKETLAQLRKKLSTLQVEFGQNFLKATEAAGLHVTNEAELDGLAPELLAEAKATAAERGLDGYYVRFSEPNFFAVQTNVTVAATREKMYQISVSRAAEVNTPISSEILALRQELAELLGYPTFAHLRLTKRMVTQPQAAKDFLADLERRYRPLAEQEHHQLREFAREYAADPTLELTAADVDSGLDWFYANKYRAASLDVNESELKEYFPFDLVRDTMFATFTTLYGVVFTRVEVPGWHPDVEVFDIHDAHSAHLARVYCDWFAHTGKRSGAWMNTFWVADRSGGKVHGPHIGCVNANIEPPQGDKPALLGLRSLDTVWHEFGHFMHQVFGNTEYRAQSMMQVYWDFVEAPSQIMENWVWEPEILRSMGRHYLTGAQLPAETAEKLRAARTFRVATKAMRQLFLGTVDLELHVDHAPAGPVDVAAVNRAVKQRFMQAPMHPDDYYLAGFAHIFQGGYAAGYYSYKWAEAIEADLFSRFATEGILNPATGRDYAEKILARGHEAHPTQLIRDFLGRDANNDAMLTRDGLTAR